MMDFYQFPKPVPPIPQTLSHSLSTSHTVTAPCSSRTTLSQPDSHLEILAQSLSQDKVTDRSLIKKRKTIKLHRKKDTTSKEYLISRLEMKLAKYQSRIEETGNVELSLDDLKCEDNSLYRLSQLEKKAAAIWEQICDLKGKSDRIMVMSELLKNVSCTPYPAINERIERFFKRNTLDLPDIVDVSDMISKVNEKEGLSLGKAELLRLSKHVLQFVGNLMSERRRADLYEVLKSRTEKDELAIGPDPLLHAPLFRSRLEENDACFKKKIQEAMSEFCVQQDLAGINNEAIAEGDPASDGLKFEGNSFCDSEHSPLFSPTLLPSDTLGNFSQYPESVSSPDLPNIILLDDETTHPDTSKQVPSSTTTGRCSPESVYKTTQSSAPRRINLVTITEHSDTNTECVPPVSRAKRNSQEGVSTILSSVPNKINQISEFSNTKKCKYLNTSKRTAEEMCTLTSPKRIKSEQTDTIVISSDEEQ